MTPLKWLGVVAVAVIAYAILADKPTPSTNSPASTVAVVTQAPLRFRMDVTECGWPTLGGQPAGRTFHVAIRNGSVRSLPLNPLYFKVETPDRRVRVAGVPPYQLRLNELQLTELTPGQQADGWLFFSVAPVELARLVYDDGFGDTATIELTNCGSPTGSG